MASSFQPGGRSPAPAPLDLVQDFVNTEIPDWDRDDIATPEALEAWLADRGLHHVRSAVDEDTLVLAHDLRSTRPSRASRSARGSSTASPVSDRRTALREASGRSSGSSSKRASAATGRG